MSISLKILAGTLALILAACSTREPEWLGTITDSAGVSIVANPVEGLWSDSTHWRIKEVVRIGSQSAPEYQFGHIAGVMETSDGRLFVLDQQAAQVKIFAPDGRYEGSFGRAGGGPGEFSEGWAGPLLLGPWDMLVIPDIGNQRLNVFGPDGSSLASYRMATDEGLRIRWETTAEGELVFQVRSFASTGSGPIPDSMTPDTVDFLLLQVPDGSEPDTLMSIPSVPSVVRRDGLPRFNIFPSESRWALSSDGAVLVARTNDFLIHRYLRDGTLVQTITRPSEVFQVSDEDREMVLTSMERIYRRWRMPERVISAVVNNTTFADRIPVISKIAGGPLGSVWVQRVRRPADLSSEEPEAFDAFLERLLGGADSHLDFGSPEWDVFGQDGRYLGVVSMPEGFTPLAFRHGRCYGVWQDEFDVEHAVVLEIEIPSQLQRGPQEWGRSLPSEGYGYGVAVATSVGGRKA